MFKLKKLIYGSEPFQLIFEMPLERVVMLLEKKINNNIFSNLTKQRIVGSINLNGIKARRVRPLFQNSFKPILEASFHEKEGKTFLVGVLRLQRFIQIFMTLWFGILFLILISAIFENMSNILEMLPLLIGAILFGIMGFAFVYFSKKLSANDRDWLKEELLKIVNE